MTPKRTKPMRPVQGYECRACGFLTTNTNEAKKHDLLPPKRKKFENGTLLVSLEGDLHESIVITSSNLRKSDHDYTYKGRGFPHPKHPTSGVRRMNTRSFANYYRSPTKREFDGFKKDYREGLRPLGINKLVKITEREFKSLTSS
jgi:hypothetical protein